MKFTVYVLYSESSGKHYTGFTSDLAERLSSHNTLGKDWSARYRPWQLIYTKEFGTKPEALQHERWLKSGVGETVQKAPMELLLFPGGKIISRYVKKRWQFHHYRAASKRDISILLSAISFRLLANNIFSSSCKLRFSNQKEGFTVTTALSRSPG